MQGAAFDNIDKVIAAGKVRGLLSQCQKMLAMTSDLSTMQKTHFYFDCRVQHQVGRFFLQCLKICLFLADAIQIDTLDVKAFSEQQPCQTQRPVGQRIINGDWRIANHFVRFLQRRFTCCNPVGIIPMRQMQGITEGIQPAHDFIIIIRQRQI